MYMIILLKEMDLYAYKNDVTEDDIYNILGNETALNIGQLLDTLIKNYLL